jgi:hypothetical protein
MPRAAIPSAPSLTPPHPRRWRKRFKRLAWIGLGLLGILLVVFLLLPVWMSNEQGRQYILERLNRGSTARINADDWSLSWFKGTRVKNLSITLPDGSRLLFCPRVKTELTLWGILLGRYDVGTTNIDTLQLALTKYADGTTSLDALAPPAGGAGTPPASSRLFAQLRSARGSLQVQSAVVTINSARAGQSVTYTDVNAAITIASPDAPFHLRVNALGPGRMLSINATLPAPADWPPNPWQLATDIDVAASNLPTGLTCDWARLDPRWQESLGPVIETLSLVHHGLPTEAGDVVLSLRSPSRETYVETRCLMRASPEAASFTIPENSGYFLRAALFASPPLVHLLAHVNPVFSSLRASDGPIGIDVPAATWSTDHPGALNGDGRLTFPTLAFERTGLLGQLLDFAGKPAATQPGYLPVVASRLRVQAANGELSFSNLSLTVAPLYRITFDGRTSADGRLHLLATIPLAPTGGLQSGTADVPITGTVAEPVITLPR